MFEILVGKPLEFLENSVWVSNNRYYIDGKVKSLPKGAFTRKDFEHVRKQLEIYSKQNNYIHFNLFINKFIEANTNRLIYLKDEAYTFIKSSAAKYIPENIVISFSGGKDSTVVADIVSRAIGNPSLVNIFGDTTLEFPSTMEY